MAKANTHSGGCLCGHIRFEVDSPLLKPHTCSCGMCPRHSGAPTLVWVEAPREAVRWAGPGGAPSVWRSSTWSSRAFCAVCGSTLGAIDDASTVGLVAGAFDRPNRKELRPEYHSNAGGRPSWWRHPSEGIV